jgi:Fe-Mn family superoxide dismutase
MNYQLPALPYESHDLEPAISAKTVEVHYGRHEKAYIDNLNRLIKDTEFDDMDIEEVIANGTGALLNNASQAWNHIFYFFSFSPDGRREPAGRLLHAINTYFGSVKLFKEAFVKAGVEIFGSGWVWLVSDDKGKLLIKQYSNAESPLREGLTPLLTFDVWEHAYYLDYQNRRADALNALWDIVDWDMVESRY